MPDGAVATVPYGEHAAQVSDLHRPAGRDPRSGGPVPVVVLIHGGFWRAGFDRHLMTPLAEDLAARGYAAWNLEYRRVGQAGGGWPGTFADVAAGVDRLAGGDLAETEGLDLDRVATVGHSAGGHLALWVAARPGLPPGAPGATPAVVARAAVAQAGVADLASGFETGLGGGACAELMGGGPADVPERYAVGSPAQRLPLGVAQVLVHGRADAIVPPSQSRDHATAATRAGDDAELVELDGVDHFGVIDPAHPAWRMVVERLPSLLA